MNDFNTVVFWGDEIDTSAVVETETAEPVIVAFSKAPLNSPTVLADCDTFSNGMPTWDSSAKLAFLDSAAECSFLRREREPGDMSGEALGLYRGNVFSLFVKLDTLPGPKPWPDPELKLLALVGLEPNGEKLVFFFVSLSGVEFCLSSVVAFDESVAPDPVPKPMPGPRGAVLLGR